MTPDTPSLQPLPQELLADSRPRQQRYYLVAVNDNLGTVDCCSLEREESLVQRLTELQGFGVRAFVFVGRRLGITKPPLRHLVVGDRRIPLDVLLPSEELDDSGSMSPDAAGVDPVYAALTAQALAEDEEDFPGSDPDVQDVEFEPASPAEDIDEED